MSSVWFREVRVFHFVLSYLLSNILYGAFTYIFESWLTFLVQTQQKHVEVGLITAEYIGLAPLTLSESCSLGRHGNVTSSGVMCDTELFSLL